jgi:hypothetical protein
MQTKLHDTTHTEAINGGFYLPNDTLTSIPYAHAQFQSTVDTQSHFAYIPDASDSRNAEFAYDNTTMPPPLPGSVDSMTKRQNSGFSVDLAATAFPDSNSPNALSPGLHSPYSAMPLTPISVGFEGNVMQTSLTPQNSAYSPPDLRRVSVQSLINELPKKRLRPSGEETERGRRYPIAHSAFTAYGYDLGLPDIDTPRNNDYSAITVFSPQNYTMGFDDDTPYGSAEPHSKEMAFESGGYYAKPVPIRISRSLEPLPPLLMENQMNLLYFHHFINHTARVLVNHDCERNPFRDILPESKWAFN